MKSSTLNFIPKRIIIIASNLVVLLMRISICIHYDMRKYTISIYFELHKYILIHCFITNKAMLKILMLQKIFIGSSLTAPFFMLEQY